MQDPDLADDPLARLDLAAFVGDQLRGLAAREPRFFGEACAQLAPAQLAAVKQCFQ